MSRGEAIEKAVSTQSGVALYKMYRGMVLDGWTLPANPDPEPVRKSAVEIEVDQRVDRLIRKDTRLTRADAIAEVLGADPALYAEYRTRTEVRV